MKKRSDSLRTVAAFGADSRNVVESDNRMVHKLIRKTAREMAAVFYEDAAHDNIFYSYYPSMKFFVDYEWAKFVHTAKRCLVDLLTMNTVSDREKEEIYEALQDDATLPYSQQETQITGFRH